TVCGVDRRASPNEVRRRLGILFDLPSPYEDMTLGEYLAFFARMAGHPSSAVDERVSWAVNLLGVPHLYRARIGRLSMGERQRAELARVLLSPAQLLLLDEPFSNVDVDMRVAPRIKSSLPAGPDSSTSASSRVRTRGRSRRPSWRRAWTSWRCGASGRWRTCTRGSRAPANQPSREACGDGLGPASPADLDHRVEGPCARPHPDDRMHGDRGHPRTAHRPSPDVPRTFCTFNIHLAR